MDEILYDAFARYYHTLGLTGYMSKTQSDKLLVLCFLRDFIYKDYKGMIVEKDYLTIERALNCIYGSSCLIPYPDYVMMGKLHLGEISELSQRVKNLEDTDVVKVIHNSEDAIGDIQSDVLILAEED